MRAKILCVGDMHLGRPVRVPESLRNEWGVEPAELRPAEAWRRSVRFAISEKVDAVLIAGDAVDQTNRLYEAQGPLVEGIDALAAAGIEVLGIAGNHDYDTLPRLADRLPHFRLIGAGGRWEIAELKCGVRVVGWSFPKQDVRQNPFDAFAEVREGLKAGESTVIGLLHCDLDMLGSTNAPVRSGDLSDPAVSAWLLGHIHKPHSLSAMARPAGYLGSICGLDPTETGVRGPWMMTVDGGSVQLTQAPLAPIRWESIELNVSDLAGPGELYVALEEAISALSRQVAQSGHSIRAVGCRIRLTGRTPDTRVIAVEISAGSLIGSVRAIDGVYYFIDDVDHARLRPALDLEQIAQGTDPPAILAGLVRSIEFGDPQGMALIQEATERFRKEALSDPWIAARLEPPDESGAREMLERAGMLALEELLGQRSGAAAPTAASAIGEPL